MLFVVCRVCRVFLFVMCVRCCSSLFVVVGCSLLFVSFLFVGVVVVRCCVVLFVVVVVWLCVVRCGLFACCSLLWFVFGC